MNNIESKVLEMKFDNEQFESAVATTMSTLDKFKEKLKFDDAGKNIHKLGQATSNYQYSLQDVGTSLSNLERYFAACGTVGSKIFDTLTSKAASFVTNGIGNLVSSVTQGGLSRAMNLEQARFQMQGIYKDAEKVHNIIYDAILPELMGTPYSLDQAAVVIGQLGASGIQSAEQVKQATRAIAGLAAMSGRGFDEVGRVFSKVAGQGNMMGGELQQLSTYGINAAANLSEYFQKVYKGEIEASNAVKSHVKEVAEAFGLDEAGIRDAASKRKIYYEDMASAMDTLYGAHAKKSTEMYTGALEDLKAALARIGAEPAAVYLNVLRDAFNALVPAVDAVNAVLKPFTNATKDVVKSVDGEKIFGGQMYGSLARRVQNLGIQFANLFVQMDENGKITRWNEKSIKAYSKSLKVLEESGKEVLDWQKDYAKYASSGDAIMNPHMWRTITALTKSFVNIFKAFGSIIGAVGKGIKKAFPKLTLENIANLAEHIEKFTKALKPGAANLLRFQNMIQAVFTPLGLLFRGVVYLAKLVVKAFSSIYNASKPVINSFMQILNAIATFIIKMGVSLTHLFKAIANMAKFASEIGSSIAKLLKLDTLLGLVQNGFQKIANFIMLFTNSASSGIENVTKKIEELTTESKFTEFAEKIQAATDRFSDFITAALHLDEITAGFKEFWEPIKEFLDSHDLFETIANGFKNLIDWFGQLIGKDTLVDRLSTSLDNLQISIGGFTAKPAEKIRTWLGDLGTHIAEFLEGLDEAGYVSTWLKDNFKLFGFVYKLGKPIKQIIEPLGGSIIEFIKAFTGIQNVGELVNTAGQWIKSGFEKIASGVGILISGGAGDKIKSLSETLFNESFAKNAEKIGKGFNLAIQPFVDALNTLGNTISKHFSSLDPQTVKKVLVSLVLLIISISYLETLRNARRTIKGFLLVLDKLAEIPKGIALFAKAFEEAMLAFKGIAKAITGVAYILAIATALVIFAAAVKILSTIDTSSLITSSLILGIAVVAIVGLFHYLNSIDYDEIGKKVLRLSMAILGVGAALMMFALAIKIIADTFNSSGGESVAVAMVAVGALIFALAGFARLLHGKQITRNINALGWAFVGIGSGMKLIAEACQMFTQNMDADELDRGVAAISQILIMFAVFAAANWHGAALGKSAFGMVGIAVALALIARTMTYMTKNLNEKQIQTVTKAIGEIVAFFAVFAFMVGLASKLGAGSLTAAAMVLSMALFVKVLGESMVMMSGLIEGGKLDKVTEVIQSFLAIMAVISLISAVGGVNAAAGPVAIAALAIALLGLAEAIYVLGTMPLGTVTLGFLRLGAALAGLVITLVVAAAAFKGFLEVLDLEDAAVLLGIGAGMLFMAASIRILAELPIDALTVAFTGFIGILLATGLVLLAFSNPAIATGLLLVGAAFALVGAAALFVGAGLMLVTLALSALIPLIVALGGTEDRLKAGLAVLQLAAEGLKEVFYRIADGVLYFGTALTVTAVGLILFAVGITAVGVSVIIASVAILALAGSFAVLASVLDAFVPQVKDSVLGTLGTLIAKVGEFFGNLREEKGRLEKELEESKETTSAAAEESTNAAQKKFEEGRAGIGESIIGLYQQTSVTEAAGQFGDEQGTELLDGFTGVISSEGPGEISGAFDGILSEDAFAGMFSNAQTSGAKIPSIFGTAVSSNSGSAEAGVAKMASQASDGVKSADGDFEKAAQGSAKKWASALENSPEPKTSAKNMVSNAASATKDTSQFSSAGLNAAKGFASGMKSGIWSWVYPAARSMARSAVSAARAELFINSPSKVFIGIGKSVGEGFVMGIDAMSANVEKTTADLMDSSIGAAKIASAAINAATNIDEFTPTITPVVDLSNVDQSVNKMGAMFNTAFGVTTPFGAMNAAFAAQSFADSRNQNKTDSINRLASKIDSMTETMNSRSLNNYFNIDGSTDPEAFADGLIRSFRLNARTV